MAVSGDSGPASCEAVVCVQGLWHRARPCLDALLKWGGGKTWRLTVVDDANDDVIAGRLKAYADLNPDRLRLIRRRRPLGSVHAFAEVMRGLEADLIFCLSPCVVVTPGWLDCLQAAFGRDGRLGLASPLSPWGVRARVPMRPGSDLLRMSELARSFGPAQTPDLAEGEAFAFVASRRALAEVGPIDELFADLPSAVRDLSERMRWRGFRVGCLDDLYVYYRPAVASHEAAPEAALQRSAAILRRRWGDSPSAAERPASIARLEERWLGGSAAPQLSSNARGSPAAGRPLEIFCVLPTLNPYGGVISVVNLLNQLIERGHHATIVSLSRCDRHPHVLYAEPAHVPAWDEIPDRFPGPFDVLLATSWETVEPVARLAARTAGGRAYYFIQDLEANFYDEGDAVRRQGVQESYARIEVKFAKTRFLCEAMASQGNHCHLIRPGMNLDLFYPRPKEPGRPPTVLAMCRLGHPHRGFDLVLKTLEEVAARLPLVEIVLFGSPELDRLTVNFPFVNAGRVNPEELPPLYWRADVFLEMSRHHGFGRSGVEAMACGTACVLSESGGVRDYAEQGVNALLVPVGDVGRAAAAVERLLREPGLRARLVRNGLKAVEPLSDAEAAGDFLDLVRRTHPALASTEVTDALAQR